MVPSPSAILALACLSLLVFWFSPSSPLLEADIKPKDDRASGPLLFVKSLPCLFAVGQNDTGTCQCQYTSRAAGACTTLISCTVRSPMFCGSEGASVWSSRLSILQVPVPLPFESPSLRHTSLSPCTVQATKVTVTVNAGGSAPEVECTNSLTLPTTRNASTQSTGSPRNFDVQVECSSKHLRTDSPDSDLPVTVEGVGSVLIRSARASCQCQVHSVVAEPRTEQRHFPAPSQHEAPATGTDAHSQQRVSVDLEPRQLEHAPSSLDTQAGMHAHAHSATGTNTTYRPLVREPRRTTDSVSSASSEATGNSLLVWPYLPNVGQTSAVVVWRCRTPCRGVVQVGTAAGNLNMKFSAAAATTDPHVRVSGLKADTQYCYSVGTTVETLKGDPSMCFRTLPALGKTPLTPLRALVLGDVGTGKPVQDRVSAAFRKYIADSGRPENMWLLLGDNVYDFGTDEEYNKYLFKYYQQDLMSKPMYTLLGNHDSASTLAATGEGKGPYFDRFPTPQKGEGGGASSNHGAYYSFDYGTVHFVCLDSYLSANDDASVMVTWLKKDLGALKSKTTKWLIGLWHHPPYSKGSVDSDRELGMETMRANVLPLFEAAGVDLVLGGHSHGYERSKVLSGHYGASRTYTAGFEKAIGTGTATDPFLKLQGLVPNSGMVSLVVGSSGQKDFPHSKFVHPANVVLSSGVAGLQIGGFMMLDVVDATSTLTCTFVTEHGEVADMFVMRKVASAKLLTPSNRPLTPTSSVSLTPSVTATVSPSGTRTRTRTVTRSPIPQVIASLSSSPSASSNRDSGLAGGERSGSSSKAHLSAGSIIIIAVWAAVVVVLALLAAWFVHLRSKRRRQRGTRPHTPQARLMSPVPESSTISEYGYVVPTASGNNRSRGGTSDKHLHQDLVNRVDSGAEAVAALSDDFQFDSQSASACHPQARAGVGVGVGQAQAAGHYPTCSPAVYPMNAWTPTKIPLLAPPPPLAVSSNSSFGRPSLYGQPAASAQVAHTSPHAPAGWLPSQGHLFSAPLTPQTRHQYDSPQVPAGIGLPISRLSSDTLTKPRSRSTKV